MKNQESIEYLKSRLAPGDSVYGQVLHVSASGMSREIALYVIHNDSIVNISMDVAKVLGWKASKTRFAIKVRGCGMDMVFHTIYSLSQVLFQDGYALKQANL